MGKIAKKEWTMYELKDIEGLARFLGSSYTAYQAVEHAAEFLSGKGFDTL